MIGGIFKVAAQMAAWGTSISATTKFAAWAAEKIKSSSQTYIRMAAESKFARHKYFNSAMRLVTGKTGEEEQIAYIKDKFARTAYRAREARGSITSNMNRAGIKNQQLMGRVLKTEAAALPMNYILYRIEKHRAVSPEDKENLSNFFKYYIGTPMAVSLTSGYLFEKHSPRFSAGRLAMKTANFIGPKKIKGALDISMAAIGKANELTDHYVAMSRARLRTSENSGIIAMLGTTSPIRLTKKMSGYYKEEIQSLRESRKTPHTIYTDMLGKILDDHTVLKNRYTEYAKTMAEKNQKAAAVYEKTTHSEINRLTKQRIEVYRKKMSGDNKFVTFMNKFAAANNEPALNVERVSRGVTTEDQILSELNITGNMPTTSYRFGSGQTQREFNFGRFSATNLREGAISTLTTGLSGTVLNLFGIKDLLQAKRAEHSIIGSVMATTNGDPLYLPMAYFDPSGELSASGIAGKMLGIDYTKEPRGSAKAKRVEGFLESRKQIYKSKYGISESSAQEDAFMRSAAHGEILMNAGELIIQKPGGETSILAFENQKSEAGKIMKVAKTYNIGYHENKRLKFMKMTTEQDTIPARLIRGHTGYEEQQYYDKSLKRYINVVHGPGKYGKVLDPDLPGQNRSIVHRLKKALDLGYSENQSFLSDALSMFRKHTDPRYPTTFFSKQYVGNNKFRVEMLKTGRSREDLLSFIRKQADDVTLEFWVGGSRSSGGTDEFIDKLIQSAEKAHPEFAGALETPLINQHMTADIAASKIEGFIGTVKKFDETMERRGINKHFLDKDIEELHRIRSLFFGKGDQNVMEIAAEISSQKETYFGGKKVSVSKIDEYNAMVLRILKGEYSSKTDSLNIGNVDRILENMGEDFNSIFGHRKSAWYASNHLSKAYHQIAESVRNSSISESDEILETNINNIEGILHSISQNDMPGFSNAYKDITRYYKKRMRFASWSPWTQDYRTKYDESMGARPGIYLIPEKTGFGFVGKTNIGKDYTGHDINIATGVMDAGNIAVMSMFHAFNRASSEMLGVGFDESQISTPGQYFEKMFTQRVLPFTLGYLGYTVADRAADQILEGTPLEEGLTPFFANMFAAVRTSAQGTLDLTGITTVSNYLEDMMPGFITSPMSGALRGFGPSAAGLTIGSKIAGPKGALTGGIVGSSIGLLLGGGPLGVFGMHDISKSRREVIQELLGEKEVAIRKGRWWELCVSEHSKIRTSSGIIEIKDAVPGQKIITHTGTVANISNISHHNEDETIVIKGSPFNLEDIKCTPDHPILIYKNGLLWAQAKDISEGDLLAYPLQKRDVRYIYVHEYINKEKPTLTDTDNGKTFYTRLQFTKNGMLSRSAGRPVKVGQDGVVNLGFNIGLIFGHYLGDGNIYRSGDRPDPRGIEIAFSENEYDKALIVQDAIHQVFGISGEIKMDSHRNMYRIRCFSSIIGEIFDEMFNGTSKTVPTWMYQAESNAFYCGLLSGLLDSDGSVSNETNIIFNNTNLGLIHLFWQACAYLGIYGATHDKNRKLTRANNHKDSYNVFLRSTESQKFKSIVPAVKCERLKPDNGYESDPVLTGTVIADGVNYLLFSVTEVTSVQGTETFYDICVDHDDHSFLGLAVTYHNSPSAYEGGKINYFRPHIYAMTRSDFRETPGYKDSLFTEIAGNLAPDLYAMKNYYSRPYPTTAGLLSNIPVFSNMIDLVTSPTHITKALTLRGIDLHKNDVSPTYMQMTGEELGLSASEVADSFVNNSGLFGQTEGSGNSFIKDISSVMGSIENSYSPPQISAMPYTQNPMERSSMEWAIGENLEAMKDIVGLRGFMLGTAFESMTGRNYLFDFAPELASPVDIAGFQKEYWSYELGGILGACIAGNQMIDTLDGQKQAMDIEPGDMVLSRDGGYHKILSVFHRQRENTMYSIKYDGNSAPLRITDNHKVMVMRFKSCINSSSRPCVPSMNKSKCNSCPEFTETENIFELSRICNIPEHTAMTEKYYYTSASQEFAECYEWAEANGILSLDEPETKRRFSKVSRFTIKDVKRHIVSGREITRYPLQIKKYDKVEVSSLNARDYLVRAIPEYIEYDPIVVDLSEFAKDGFTVSDQYIYSSRPGQDYIKTYEYLESNQNHKSRKDLAELIGVSESCVKDALYSFRHVAVPKRWNRFVTITEELSYFIGWYIAEGSTDNSGKVSLSMNIDEKAYAEGLKTIITDTFGLMSYIRQKGENGMVFSFNHPVFAVYLKETFGSYCYSKRLPYEYWVSSRMNSIQFIKGMFLGDGSIMMKKKHSKQDCNFHTTSVDLAYTFHTVLSTFGIVSSMTVIPERGNKLKSYLIHINSFNSIKLTEILGIETESIDRSMYMTDRDRIFICNGFIHYPIRQISVDENQEDTVYDFEVEDIHYYHAGFVCISNSEVIRRYVPHRRNSIQLFNPIRNTMPTWLPGYDYYQNFQHGDPYNVIQMGEARLPGPGYETLHNVDLTMPVIDDILGESVESQTSFYLGLPGYMAKRNRDSDTAAIVAIQVVEDAKRSGDLISDKRVVYDPSTDATATVDATLRNRYGKMLPVKVAPAGYGGDSALNAFLSLSNIDTGMLIEVDTQNGGIRNKIIKRDIRKFEKELKRNSKARVAAYSQISKLEDEGKAFNLANAYSWMDRFKILSDVAFYSKEYKTARNIVKQQINAGYLPPEAMNVVAEIDDKVDAKKKAYNFSEYKFRDYGEGITPYTKSRDRYIGEEYGALERIVGHGWERLTHLRNPIQVKMFHNTDALEEYERNVIYGKNMRMWQHPIEDYIKTYVYTGVGVDTPSQGAASWATAGYFMGGFPLAATMSLGGLFTGTLNQTLGIDYVPERAQDVREMINQTDAVKYLRFRQLYEETGDQKFLSRSRSTMTGMAVEGHSYDASGLGMGMGKPDRDYAEDIINNITRNNFRRSVSILPDPAVAAIYSSVGMKPQAQGIMSEYGEKQMERNVPAMDSPVYDLSVPLESTIINTYEMKGMNCLLPDSLIITENGIIPIDNIDHSDRVLNDNGEFVNPVKVYSSKYTGEILEISFSRTPYKLKVTGNHRIPVMESYGKYNPVTKTSPRLWRKREIEANEILGPKRYKLIIPSLPLKEDTVTFKGYTLDNDMAIILGWYLAEGYLPKVNGKHKGVSYGLCIDEYHYAKEIAEAIERKFKSNAVIKTYKSSTSGNAYLCVRSYNTKMASIINELCGEYSSKKKINPILMSAPVEFIRKMIECWFLGDGWTTTKEICVHTNSQQLSYQGWHILNSVGIPACLQYVASRDKNKKEGWRIRVSKANCTDPFKTKWNSIESFNLSVTSREVKPYEGQVYDIEMPKSHYYVTISGIVHNSHDAGYGWYDQIAQIERMKSLGRFPDESLYGKLTSRVSVKDAVRSIDSTQSLKKSLMRLSRQVDVFEDGLERVEVDIIMR